MPINEPIPAEIMQAIVAFGERMERQFGEVKIELKEMRPFSGS